MELIGYAMRKLDVHKWLVSAIMENQKHAKKAGLLIVQSSPNFACGRTK